MGERRDADGVWWGKRPLGRLRRRWRIILNGSLGSGIGSSTGLIWLRDRWRAVVNSAMNLRVPYNAREFVD
jgi:hypothetical protein